jgi:hypothetical protein
MSGNNAESQATENRLRSELRRVRLVFELGFPEELVTEARLVIEQARRTGAMFRHGQIRYPACFIVTVVAEARTYNGQGFWDSQGLRFIGLRPTDLADHTYASFDRLDLETFEEFTRAENALRKLSPVLMHAGVAAPNVDELVSLIASAGRQHLFEPEEQIAAWSRRPSGFRGLWRASQLLFKYGGAIAIDLLDRFNEALTSGDPSLSGLPAHLQAALDAIDDAKVRAAAQGRSNAIGRPVVVLDPWSCDGPMVRIPQAPSELVSRWRTTGSDLGEVVARQAEIVLPLAPRREWEVTALCGSSTAARWTLPAYVDLPVVLFDGRSGKLLRLRGGQRELESNALLSLVHPKVDFDESIPIAAEFPEPVGEWAGWRIVEIDARHLRSLLCKQRDGEATEQINLVKPPRRPELVGAVLRGVRTVGGVPVYAAAPALRLDVGSVDPDAVEVEVSSAVGSSRSTLRQLGDGPEYDLDSLFEARTGVCTVRVRGPLGLRLPATELAVIPGLTIAVQPTVAVADDDVRAEVVWAGGSTVLTIGPRITEALAEVDGEALTVEIERVSWGVRQHGEATSAIGFHPVSIAVDEITSGAPPLLNLIIGAAVRSSLELRAGDKRLQTLEAPYTTGRWTAALERFADTVRSQPAPVLDLVLVVDHRTVPVGRIHSRYVPSITSVVCDPSISPPIVEALLEENRPFRSRVARLWSLDRPWEPSLRIPLADDMRSTLMLRLPENQRSGPHRLMLRVEEPWDTAPRLPGPATPGVIDVQVSGGTSLDPDDPLDRIIGALRLVPGFTPTDDDLSTFGHYLIAHLTQGLRDAGRVWLSTATAGRALHLLERQPHALPTLLTRAVLEGWIDRQTADTLTIALFPSLLQLEQEVDLELPADAAEGVWATLPVAAAAIESWSDSPDACERWARYIGWPKLVAEVAEEDGEPRLMIDQQPLALLTDQFRNQVRIALLSPEFADVLTLLGTLNEQPLSADARLRAIIDVLLARCERPHTAWLERHFPTVSSAHRRASASHAAAWVQSVSLDARAAQRGVFADIAALAVAVMSRDSSGIVVRDALLDAYGFAPLWVMHCLVQALAFDHHRHTGPLAEPEAPKDAHANP